MLHAVVDNGPRLRKPQIELQGVMSTMDAKNKWNIVRLLGALALMLTMVVSAPGVVHAQDTTATPTANTTACPTLPDESEQVVTGTAGQPVKEGDTVTGAEGGTIIV